MKICKRCGETRPLDAFHKGKNYAGGRRPVCKSCHYSDTNASRKANPDKDAAYQRRGWLKRRYGIDEAIYEKMLLDQRCGCAICGQINQNGYKLAVDHSHVTGKVRALLCNKCNSSLGLMRESPDILRAAARYLELHDTTNK
jgi:hypothetical protein